jgi:hypothetical protein
MKPYVSFPYYEEVAAGPVFSYQNPVCLPCLCKIKYYPTVKPTDAPVSRIIYSGKTL